MTPAPAAAECDRTRAMSGWLLLALAIAAEVAATLSLRASRGFTQLAPSLVVVVGYVVAFYFLSLALKTIELGSAYAIWSGLGTAVIFIIGILALNESSSPLKVISIALIVAGVMGLNAADGRPA